MSRTEVPKEDIELANQLVTSLICKFTHAQFVSRRLIRLVVKKDRDRYTIEENDINRVIAIIICNGYMASFRDVHHFKKMDDMEFLISTNKLTFDQWQDVKDQRSWINVAEKLVGYGLSAPYIADKEHHLKSCRQEAVKITKIIESGYQHASTENIPLQ